MSCSDQHDVQGNLAQLPADQLTRLAMAGVTSSSHQVLLLMPVMLPKYSFVKSILSKFISTPAMHCSG